MIHSIPIIPVLPTFVAQVHTCTVSFCRRHKRACAFVLACGECVFAVVYFKEGDVLPAYLFTAQLIKHGILGLGGEA